MSETPDSVISKRSNGVRELKILVASDIHLGYQDRSTERRLDSLNAFEEVLQIADKEQANFVLLAGDLFHVNDPPKWVVKESMRLLRKYCFGDRDIDFRLTSDQSKNFEDSDVPIVNYEDPNINVKLPVFTIHGNHDDPVGVQHESVVKLLSTGGLINYFGRVRDFTEIELEPLLFEKSRIKLAVYGLGAIRDERLSTLFREGKIHFKWPEDTDRWFKILLLHQNRVKRGPGNYIPESFLPKELDLVIWGHEHECIMDFQWNGYFKVLQPGSTVATSLCPGEVPEKCVGILNIQFDKADQMHKCTLDRIPLQTVRQLYVEDVELSKMPKNNRPMLEREFEYLKDTIEDIVERAVGERTGHRKQPPKPLVRLRVLYGPDHEQFLSHYVGRHFKDKIANPGDCIHFVKDKELWNRQKSDGYLEEDKFLDAFEEQKKSQAKIEDMLNTYFKKATDSNSKLHVIHEDAFSRAIQLCVEKGNSKEIIHKLIESSARQMRERLTKECAAIDEHSIIEYFRVHKKEALEEDEDVKTVIKDLDNLPSTVKTDTSISDPGDFPKTGRGRGRGRGKTVVKEEPVSLISDDDEDVPTPTSRGRGRGGGRGRAQPAKKAASAKESFIEDSDGDDFESFVSPAQPSKPKQRKINTFVASNSRKAKRKASPEIEDFDDEVVQSSLGSSSRKSQKTTKKARKPDVMGMFDDFD